MQDMMKMYSMNGNVNMFNTMGQTLILNANNSLVRYILDNTEADNINMLCEQLYDLAMLSHGPLAAEQMTKFIARSNEILSMITK